MPAKLIRPLLLLYGLLNAALYSSLLPLWEGFDEEFHYGYVQYLGVHHRFPVLGHTGLSQEVNQSIGLLPMSHAMVKSLHLTGVRTFDQYFSLPDPVRRQLYHEARRIPPGFAVQESDAYSLNYEVHQAPLAYLVLAVPDRLLARVPLPRRVWILRLLVSMACVLLMLRGAFALAGEAGLRSSFAAILVFLVFSCQMFWATIAHIGNDWLAVPLAVWLIVWALRCHLETTLRRSLWLAVVLALGLLTKAYFLVFVPLYLVATIVWYRKGSLTVPWLAWLAVWLGVPALVAGPWYVRNWVVFGNLSGRLEESSGVAGALASLAAVPWLKSIPYMARGAFWMGNSSFTDFSVRTMDLVLVLLGIGLCLYVRTLSRGRWTEAILWAPVVLFCAAMLYGSGSSYNSSQGLLIAASPWYLQAVMTSLLCMAMLGCQRSGSWGRWLARATVVLWGYILAATYVAKLFPLYGGFVGGRSTLRDITHWYLMDSSRAADLLGTTAMVPAVWLVTLLAILLPILLAAVTVLIRADVSAD
ncbi:MAG TPA: hypothetical protein VN841_22380 [Bryobacteraceae bacterium]|nr:hypothetical protein [Bryobacteraceae bacterium]